jgi:IclR family pca regulon transcriptional regulator
MTIALALGSRLPAAFTSMGRVLLADLPPERARDLIVHAPLHARTERTITDPDRILDALAEVRRLGWALVDQELEDGVRSIAAPLRDRRGRAVAAINVSTHAGRVSLRELRSDVLPELLVTARTISDRLRTRG